MTRPDASSITDDELDALHARLEQAEARIAAVRALHYTRGRNPVGQPVCNECLPLQPMPCPTLRALDSLRRRTAPPIT